jgi:hypothetical protein
VAASSGKSRCYSIPPANPKLPMLQVHRLRMESWLPNWQNRAMNFGGASGCGGFSGLALRQASSTASLWPVPSFQFRPFGQALRMLSSPSLPHQNNGQAQVRWNPSQFNQPRAITMGSTGRVVSSWPASPGWLSGRAG